MWTISIDDTSVTAGVICAAFAMLMLLCLSIQAVKAGCDLLWEHDAADDRPVVLGSDRSD